MSPFQNVPDFNNIETKFNKIIYIGVDLKMYETASIILLFINLIQNLILHWLLVKSKFP